MRPCLILLFATVAAVFFTDATSANDAPFEIWVIDQQTGRGVPLVELETVNNVVYITDSNGLVAINEPGLIGQRVFFSVRSHGYEFAKDGFGYAGKALEITAGGKTTLEIKRINIAQRLYRVTGADTYRDSVLLDRDVPIQQPLLNAKVYGSDSVVNTLYRGRIHWFWGDTNQPAYPLGNFDVPGAISQSPASGGLDPDAGVELSYFVGENGFARPVAKMPGDGPTWIDGLVTLVDKTEEEMFATFVKIKPPLSAYARGLIKWNDKTKQFDKVVDFPLDAPALPGGHPVKHSQGDLEYVYFAKPYPLTRVRATSECLARLEDYESFTCLADGSTLQEPKLERNPKGMLRYSWKRNTPSLDWKAEKKLIDAGVLKQDEALLALRDRDTGKPVIAHGGSVYWNEHRQRWVMIFLEIFGSPSFLGEVWFAEADSLVGPWVYATKIVSHDRYDFYNPKQHPMFDADGGRIIYFEGTYTNTFSGNPVKTPRYDYNQVMYKLELDDPRLALPVAVYRSDEGELRAGTQVESIKPEQVAFFALDRSTEGAIAVYAEAGGSQLTTTVPANSQEAKPIFYGLPADMTDPPATAMPLHLFVKSSSGERIYATDSQIDEYQREGKPVCLVWRSPLQFTWEAERQ
jgi:hypothetical protein